MTSDTNISRVYFIGIGGIGMSALARYFLGKGAVVSGYDKTPSDIISRLEQEGALVHFEEDTNLLDTEADLVIYTPAIPPEHKELMWYRAQNFNVKKRSEVLADVTAGGFNICIAGTHGKTTMSTLTAHILRYSGYGCTAFLGGISVNYETNFWAGDNTVNVVEADEYDRSFLRLKPDIALISAMDPDHLDIYGNVDNMKAAFYQFAGLVEEEKGLLVTKFGLRMEGAMPHQHLTYSLQNESADVYAQNILIKDGGYEFDIKLPDAYFEDFRVNMGGMYNVENAVAAITIAQHLGIDENKIREAVRLFRGVHRRFEYKIDVQQAKKLSYNVVYIDDYAHHPEELKALLKGARSLFNDRWITIIFQPHLFSRTRDLYKDFAEALSIANTVILMPIYPARELPIKGITSELIAREITSEKVEIMDAGEVENWIKDDYLKSHLHAMNGEVLITAGAGNIDRLVNPIQQILLNQ